MWALLLVLGFSANALAGEICYVPEYPACNLTIINSIITSWGAHPPKNIIKLVESYGKVITLSTTPYLYSECTQQYYSYVTYEPGSLFALVEDYSVSYDGYVKYVYYNVEEVHGYTYDRVNEISRYVWYNDPKGHVLGVYACSQSIYAQPSEEAIAFIVAKGREYSKASVTKALTKGTKLDFNLSKWYTDHLECKY